MISNRILEGIQKHKLVAIIRGIGEDRILETVQALADGGIKVMEVTLNREDAVRSIKLISHSFGNDIVLGAGTVLNGDQVRLVAENGAGFIVSPNVDLEVIKETKQLGMVSIPGAFTPSEIVAAHNAGADFVKLFPAGSLGADYIKAIRAPLDNIPLLAVGGIDLNNIPLFFRAGVVGVGIGGNLVNKKLIEAGRYDEIRAIAREYSSLVKG